MAKLSPVSSWPRGPEWESPGFRLGGGRCLHLIIMQRSGREVNLLVRASERVSLWRPSEFERVQVFHLKNAGGGGGSSCARETLRRPIFTLCFRPTGREGPRSCELKAATPRESEWQRTGNNKFGPQLGGSQRLRKRLRDFRKETDWAVARARADELAHSNGASLRPGGCEWCGKRPRGLGRALCCPPLCGGGEQMMMQSADYTILSALQKLRTAGMCSRRDWSVCVRVSHSRSAAVVAQQHLTQSGSLRTGNRRATTVHENNRCGMQRRCVRRPRLAQHSGLGWRERERERARAAPIAFRAHAGKMRARTRPDRRPLWCRPDDWPSVPAAHKSRFCNAQSPILSHSHTTPLATLLDAREEASSFPLAHTTRTHNANLCVCVCVCESERERHSERATLTGIERERARHRAEGHSANCNRKRKYSLSSFSPANPQHN